VSTISPPPAGQNHIEQERARIGRLLDEIARLSEGELPPSTFFGEMLKRLLEALGAPAGAVWLRTPSGGIQQVFQINFKEAGLEKNEQSRQSHDELLMLAFSKSRQLHLMPNSGLGQGREGKLPPANPSSYMLLMVPIGQAEPVQGVIEVLQNPQRPLNAVPGFLQYMGLMAELCTRYLRHQRMNQLATQQTLWTQLEAFARQIHASLNPTEVAFTVANEGRRLIECDRVSVAVRFSQNCGIEAISGADVVEKRSNLVQLMKTLCDRVLTWDEKLVFTGEKDDSLPPKVLEALDNYLAESPSKLLVIQPLKVVKEVDEFKKEEPDKKPARAALVMECFDPPAEAQQILGRTEVIARHAAPAMQNAVEHRRIPLRFIWMPLAKLQEGLGGKARTITTLILVGLSLLIGAMIFVPYPLKMSGTGTLLPVIRRVIYSPTIGQVKEFYVLPGEDILENRSLALLSDLDLDKNMLQLATEMANASREALDAEKQEKNPALNLNDRLKYSAEREKQKYLYGSKSKELQTLIERTSADPQRRGFFFLKAPAFTPEEVRQILESGRALPKQEWTVLTPNFREEWSNRQAKPSEPIMRLGAKDGPWEIELKIPQKHIGQVLKAFEQKRDKKDPSKTPYLEVDFLTLSDPTRTFKGILYRDKVAFEATPHQNDQNEPEPVVTAFVRIDDPNIPKEWRIPSSLLLSGTEVHAKVRCGNHRLGYSLFYGVWEFIYEKVVFFF